MIQATPTNSESPSSAAQADTDDQVEIPPAAVPENAIPSLETIQYSSEKEPAHSKSYRWTKGSMSSNKTIQEDGAPQEIPIAAPVPLLYSARSKAVLRSMMSSGLVEELSTSLEEQLLSPETESLAGLETGGIAARPRERTTQQKTSSVTTFKPTMQAFRPIRPVSPSTLMALTEPVLMAWCTETPPTSIPPPPIYPAAVQMANPQIQTSLGQQSRNLWGY